MDINYENLLQQIFNTLIKELNWEGTINIVVLTNVQNFKPIYNIDLNSLRTFSFLLLNSTYTEDKLVDYIHEIFMAYKFQLLKYYYDSLKDPTEINYYLQKNYTRKLSKINF